MCRWGVSIRFPFQSAPVLPIHQSIIPSEKRWQKPAIQPPVSRVLHVPTNGTHVLSIAPWEEARFLGRTIQAAGPHIERVLFPFTRMSSLPIPWQTPEKYKQHYRENRVEVPFPVDVLRFAPAFLANFGDFLDMTRGPFHKDSVGVMINNIGFPMHLYRSTLGAHQEDVPYKIADAMYQADFTDSHFVMFHVRRASRGSIRMENVHPFGWNDWVGKLLVGFSGLHSGDLANYNELPLDQPCEADRTDSEHLLRYIYERILDHVRGGDRARAFHNGLIDGITYLVEKGEWYLLSVAIATRSYMAIYSATNFEFLKYAMEKKGITMNFSHDDFYRYGTPWALRHYWDENAASPRLQSLTIASQPLPYVETPSRPLGWEPLPQEELMIWNPDGTVESHHIPLPLEKRTFESVPPIDAKQGEAI